MPEDKSVQGVDFAPDWPPQDSAASYPEGTRKYSSTGQEWQVRNGQWVRLTKPKLVTNE